MINVISKNSEHFTLLPAEFQNKLKIEICINIDLLNLENVRATSFHNNQSWMTMSGTDLTSLVDLLLSFVVIFSLPRSLYRNREELLEVPLGPVPFEGTDFGFNCIHCINWLWNIPS